MRRSNAPLSLIAQTNHKSINRQPSFAKTLFWCLCGHLRLFNVNAEFSSQASHQKFEWKELTNPTSSCPAHLPVCLIFRNDKNLRLSSQHLPIRWHALSSLVHPEKSQCGNGTKLNTKLGQLYLNMYPTCSHIPMVMVIYYQQYYYEPEPKYSGCKQPTFPSCFCGPMNKFLQEGGGSKMSPIFIWLGISLHTFSKEKIVHRRQILPHDANMLSI